MVISTVKLYFPSQRAWVKVVHRLEPSRLILRRVIQESWPLRGGGFVGWRVGCDAPVLNRPKYKYRLLRYPAHSSSWRWVGASVLVGSLGRRRTRGGGGDDMEDASVEPLPAVPASRRTTGSTPVLGPPSFLVVAFLRPSDRSGRGFWVSMCATRLERPGAAGDYSTWTRASPTWSRRSRGGSGTTCGRPWTRST